MKKYIVTGAGQGIGHQIAQQLMAEGHVVLVNDIDASLLKGSLYSRISRLCGDTSWRFSGFRM